MTTSALSQLDPTMGLRIDHIVDATMQPGINTNEHTIIVDPGNDHSIIAVIPAGSECPSGIESPEYLKIVINASRTRRLFGELPPFHASVNIADSFLHRIVIELNNAVTNHARSRPLLIDSLCVSLLIHLNSRYPVVQTQRVNGMLTSAQLLAVSDYIHSRLGENTSMQQLCALVNLSRFHFTRLFKTTVGITPHKYILKSKIEYAKSFMTRGKGAILDAAYRLSFADHAHFTKTFRKFTGTTPKAYLASSF
jgi:AraC-like DNA-binding protein